MRVDIYLSTLFSDFSRSYIQKLIDKGQVQVNNQTITKNLKISPKDEIFIEIKLENLDILPENIPLDILYEDTNLIIINKDAGMNVHPVPGEGGNQNTLVNAILYHSQKKKEENFFSNNPILSINGVARPGIVHRLDKDTSGVILVAKTDSMMQYLSEIIKNRHIKKEYIAIVSGIIKEKEFEIESYIGRDRFDRKKMSTIDPINPKIAYTKAKLLKYIGDKYSILSVQILTGRTHQIRVHLASIGFPIIGDTVYGKESINREVEKDFGLTRQALHAEKLEFELYGKSVVFEAPLKQDMRRIIENK